MINTKKYPSGIKKPWRPRTLSYNYYNTFLEKIKRFRIILEIGITENNNKKHNYHSHSQGFSTK